MGGDIGTLGAVAHAECKATSPWAETASRRCRRVLGESGSVWSPISWSCGSNGFGRAGMARGDGPTCIDGYRVWMGDSREPLHIATASRREPLNALAGRLQLTCIVGGDDTRVLPHWHLIGSRLSRVREAESEERRTGSRAVTPFAVRLASSAKVAPSRPSPLVPRFACAVVPQWDFEGESSRVSAAVKAGMSARLDDERGAREELGQTRALSPRRVMAEVEI